MKTFRDKEYQAKSKARSVRLRVSVCGTVESQTGLKMATVLIEKLDDFFEQDSLRLEEIVEGENSMQIIRKIPNTRIAQRISEEDSFLYNPDSTRVQDIQDDRMVTITFQEET